MNKRLIVLFCALAFFLGAVTYYINTVTIPQDLKRLVLQETSKFLGRKVGLKNMRFNPFTGFILDGVVIYEENSPDVFATIDRVRVHVMYWPLVRSQKVILSSVEITNPSLNLIHYADEEWNFSDIIRHRQQRASQAKQNIYLSRLIVSDGYVHLTNLEDGMQFSETFDPINAAVTLSISKGIVFEGSVRYGDKRKFLETNGSWNPLKSQFNGAVKCNGLAIKNYLDLFKTQLPLAIHDISAESMDIQLNLRKHMVNLSGDIALGALTIDKDQWKVSLHSLSAQTFSFGYQDGEYRFKGHVNADGVKTARQDQNYESDRVNVQLNNWVSRGGTVTADGSLSASQISVSITDRLNVKADLQLTDIALARSAKALTVQGGIEIKNLALASGEVIRMNGQLLSPALTFTNASGTTTVKGDLYANNLIYAWPGKELRATLALTGIQAVGNSDAQWNIKTQINSPALSLTLPRGNTLATGIAGQTTIEYSIKEHKFQVKSACQLTNAAFAMPNGMRLTGSPSGTVVVTSKKDPLQPVPYSGALEFKGAILSGTKLGTVEDIRGNVAFENNRARTSDLNLRVLGRPALLTGTLDDFSSPSLDVTVHVNNFDLAQTERIIPQVIKNNGLVLSGNAPGLSVSYQGPATTTEGADISFEAQVEKASLTAQKIDRSASNLSGNIHYENKILFWENLSADYNGRPYHLKGHLTPADQAKIDTEIEGDHFKLKTQLEYTRDAITFKQLMGVYKTAVFNLTGSTQTITGGGTLYDLNGTVDLNLKDLPDLVPNLNDGIKNCRLEGQTNIKGSFKGDPSHWQDWQYDLTGASPEFSIMGLSVKNMKFNAVQKNNLLKPFHVWGEFYDGDLNLVASLDTAKQDLPFELVSRITDSSLNKLRADTPLKKQAIAGSLSLTTILNGRLTDLKALSGKGGIEIKDGMLWELDLLKGLGGLLLIPEYKDIIFTQAGMNFTMAGGVISTDNIQLLGPSLNLFGRGTLDLNHDQALELLLSPDFNTSVVAGSSSLKKGTTAIITGTEKFMSVEVSGTLTKPKYRVNNAPVKILQKTGGVILENVSQFFQNIF